MKKDNLSRRATLQAVAGSLALWAASAAADAVYPAKPIRLILPVTPGGGADVTARHVAQRLGSRLGQQLIVENRPGAGGLIAADSVAKSVPDGLTLLWAIMPGYALLPSQVRQMPYDTARDLVAITTVTRYPTILVVNKDVPAQTVHEFADLLRANPEKFSYGTPEITARFIVGRLMQRFGVYGKVVHVAYKGAPQQLQDNVAGLVQFGVTTMGAIQPFLQGGRLRVLAVLGDSRVAAMPDVPTLTEAGFPDVAVQIENTLFAPALTPIAVLERIRSEVNAVFKADDAALATWMGISAQMPGGEPVVDAQSRFRRQLEAITLQAAELGLKPE